MKKISNTLKSLALLTLILFVTIACDKDFANIDSDIAGVKNFATKSKLFPIVSYTQKITDNTTGVQTSNLSGNLLGIYNDPNSTYGTTTSGIISQVVPANLSPDFETNPVLESVILTIPYFTTIDETDEDGNSVYVFDSLFGSATSSYKLSIYQSNYLLRGLDPDTSFEEAQVYYSNQEDEFCAQIGELLYTNDNFIPDLEEIHFDEDGAVITDTTTEVVSRLSPSLRVELLNPNGDFWENLIFLNQDNAVLSNSNNFTNFFRGLIFKVEANTGQAGHMQVLNLSNSASNIVLNYASEEDIEDETSSEYTLNFSGVTVTTLDNEFILPITPNTTLGDDNLYLKGGDGAMSVIELFNGSTLDEEDNTVDAFTYFKAREGKWLINEVNLIFHVDQTQVVDNEPDRLLLYDLKNNVPLIDYYLDGSTSTTDPTNSKTNFAEILERDSDDNGTRYKFRITQHINNLLIRDSTNVKLGLYITNNINNAPNSNAQNSEKNSRIQNVIYDQDDSTINTFVPSSSVLSLKGTVLHGSKPSLPEGQRAEFEIFYTEPEN